jgi:hypothetical protein
VTRPCFPLLCNCSAWHLVPGQPHRNTPFGCVPGPTEMRGRSLFMSSCCLWHVLAPGPCCAESCVHTRALDVAIDSLL